MNMKHASSEAKPKAAITPFVWRRDWAFSRISPYTTILQRFGICGECEVACREGMKRVRDIVYHDQIITRRHGFVSAIGLMHNPSENFSGEGSLRVGISEGALGNGLPQQFVVLGARNEISRYVQSPKSRRLSVVSLALANSENFSAIRNCESGDLFVPIFRETVEISVAGVYVNCPSMSDISMKSGFNASH